MSTYSHVPAELLTGSAATAVGAAFLRQQESARPDRLYDDPWAGRFVEHALGAFRATPDGTASWEVMTRLAQAGSPWRAIAVRVLDDIIRGFVASGCTQLVIPGVGLDTRSSRLRELGPVTVYELDIPPMIALRESVLGSSVVTGPGRSVAVATDLTGAWDDALIGAGLDPEQPTAWAVESVLSYLDRTAGQRFVARLSELSCAGSRLTLTYTRESALARGTSRAIYDRVAAVPGVERFISGGERHLGPGAEELLSAEGWQLDYLEGAALAAGLGRPLGPEETSDFLVGRRGRP